MTAITAMALFVAASIFLWQVNTTLPSGVDLKLMEVKNICITQTRTPCVREDPSLAGLETTGVS